MSATMYGCEIVWPNGERHRRVLVGDRPELLGDEELARHALHRREHALVADPPPASCRSIQAGEAATRRSATAKPKCSSTSALDLGDRRRRRADADRQHRHLGVLGGESAVAAAAEWLRPGEVDELPARRGRDEHLARVRVAERGLGARASRRDPSRSATSSSPSRRPPPRRPRGRARRRPRARRRAPRPGAADVAVDHRRRGSRRSRARRRRRARADLLDERLAVVGAERRPRSGRGTRRARRPPRAARRSTRRRGRAPRARRRGRAHARRSRSRGGSRRAGRSRRVSRASARSRRRTRRSSPSARLQEGDRRARPVGLVDAVEEEALRPVHGREARDRRQVPVPAAVGGDVDRRGREPGLLERLVHRLGAPAGAAR